MSKIRPNNKPTAPLRTGKPSASKQIQKRTSEETKPAVDQAPDHGKTAAGFTKSKTSRMGKLIKGKPAAGNRAAVAGKGKAKNLSGLMKNIVRRTIRIAKRRMARLTLRVDRFNNIMLRHHELGYVVRLGSKHGDENEEEIKKAGLRLKELGAGAGDGSPGLTRLMEQTADLDQNSSPAEWAAKFKDARELIDQTSQELSGLESQLARELQSTEEKLAEAKETQSEILDKFEKNVDSILNNI